MMSAFARCFDDMGTNNKHQNQDNKEQLQASISQMQLQFKFSIISQCMSFEMASFIMGLLCHIFVKAKSCDGRK